MATSGTIVFNETARQLVTFALKKAKIIDALHDPSSEELTDAIEELDLMLKAWQLRGPNLWRATEGSQPLSASTASYALSPQPRRVIEARYRNTGGTDIPMFELTRQQYSELSLKTATGVPTQYYVDYQRTTATMYVWPVPASVTTETIKFTYDRKLQDVGAADNDLDIPQEYFETIGYALADKLSISYGQRDPDLAAMAAMMVQQAIDDDREPFVQFVPGY